MLLIRKLGSDPDLLISLLRSIRKIGGKLEENWEDRGLTPLFPRSDPIIYMFFPKIISIFSLFRKFNFVFYIKF